MPAAPPGMRRNAAMLGDAQWAERDPVRVTKGTRTFIFVKGTRTFIFDLFARQNRQRMGLDPLSLPPVPRHRRAIFPGIPHHVTQRGNHRERVFLSKGDPEAYLSLLHAYSRRFGIAIFAYCLMPNHVHLVVKPTSSDGMPRALRAVHCQYAQRIHRMRAITGHLWQGRYYSSALDPPHFLNAIRYVELNPVRARLIARPEDYPWSSAAARCGQRFDPLLEPQQSSTLPERDRRLVRLACARDRARLPGKIASQCAKQPSLRLGRVCRQARTIRRPPAAVPDPRRSAKKKS